jgi:hypothetical protein
MKKEQLTYNFCCYFHSFTFGTNDLHLTFAVSKKLTHST